MKLNLRDLFWLLLVIGMGICWWRAHHEASRYKKAIARMQALGAVPSTEALIQNRILSP